MKGVLPCLVPKTFRAGTTDFCSALAALVGPVQNFCPHLTPFQIPLYPSPINLGRQPCWVACLLVCVSLVEITAHLLIEGGCQVGDPSHAKYRTITVARYPQIYAIDAIFVYSFSSEIFFF